MRSFALGRIALFLLASCLALGASPAARADSAHESPVVIFLVRHAETLPSSPEESPRNPHLDERGLERAKSLAHLLGDAALTTLFSSDYHRTRETVAPVAGLLGLHVTLYDPGALEEFAAKLRSTPGRHLVAGHSNTTPQLVEHLGGDPGDPIDDAWEYDRLYVVTIDSTGRISTVLLRYGEPSSPSTGH